MAFKYSNTQIYIYIYYFPLLKLLNVIKNRFPINLIYFTNRFPINLTYFTNRFPINLIYFTNHQYFFIEQVLVTRTNFLSLFIILEVMLIII